MLNSVVWAVWTFWAIWAVLALTGESRVEVVDFQDASELRRRLSSPKLKQSFGSITASTQDSILVTVVRIFVVEIDAAYRPEELAPDVVWQPFNKGCFQHIQQIMFYTSKVFCFDILVARGRHTTTWGPVGCRVVHGISAWSPWGGCLVRRLARR